MNKKTVFPNNPIFFLQFIIFPLIIFFILYQVGFTVDKLVQVLGTLRIAIILFAYFLFVIGMVRTSMLIISEEHIAGPGTEVNLFPVKLPLVDSECLLEDRRTGKFRCKCLIIKNKYKRGEICLPSVYFTSELFDMIVNLIRDTNEQRPTKTFS